MRLFIFIFLFLVLPLQAAYNPFEPDVIKVTNTATANINVDPQAEFNNINTTAVLNTNTDVFTSVTSNGVFCVPGIYIVDVVLYHESTSQRSNQALEVTVNSVSTGIRGANGYIRSISTNHREASSTVADVVELTTTSKIGFDVMRLTENSTGNVSAPVGRSSMRIVRVDDR